MDGFAYAPGCDNCCGCPPCDEGSLACTACGEDTDTARSYEVRFAGWVNNSCSICTDRNVTVTCGYVDNSGDAPFYAPAPNPIDCLCHYEGFFDWHQEDSNLSTPTPSCDGDHQARVRLYIQYVSSGEEFCQRLVVVDLDIGPSGGPYSFLAQWVLQQPAGAPDLTGKPFPCNYFDSDVEIPQQTPFVETNPNSCKDQDGHDGSAGDPYQHIQAFVKKA